MQHLTDTDFQIIEELRKDAQQPNHQIATVIGVSEETVRRRVLAMISTGVLQFNIDVSAEALGMPVSALINVKLPPDSNECQLTNSGSLYVKRVHDTVEGHQVYEIAAKDLGAAGAAMTDLRSNPQVTDATITFLYPNGDHRI